MEGDEEFGRDVEMAGEAGRQARQGANTRGNSNMGKLTADSD